MTAMVFMAQGGREFKSFFMGYRFSVLLLLGCKGKRGKTCLPQTRLPSSLFHRSIHPEMCVECSNAYDSTVVCSSMYISISRYVAAQPIPKLIQKKMCSYGASVHALSRRTYIRFPVFTPSHSFPDQFEVSRIEAYSALYLLIYYRAD